MKRAYTVLAVLLMAATTFSQDSRRTASTNSSARTARTRTQEATPPSRSNTKTERVVVNSRSQQARVNNNKHQKSTTVASRNNSDYRSNRNNYSQSTNRNNSSYKRPQKAVTTTTRTTTNHRVETPRHSNRNHHAKHSNHGKHYNHGHSTTRVYRGHHKSSHVYRHAPHTREYRARHYTYRKPHHIHVVWSRDLHRHYIRMYPSVRHWEYRYGYQINSVSAYYADYYIGDVRTVYGKVKEVFYSPESDEYFLHMGAYYPYHDFTIVLPGHIARKYTARPIRYFTNEYLNVTGLITSFEGKPEIVVKRKFQLDVY